MKIIFLTDQPMPNGMAATNRILSLAKGIASNQHEVSILILNPTEKNGRISNKETSGTIDGVAFRYLSSSTIVPGRFLPKFRLFLEGFFRMFSTITRMHKKGKVDAIIIEHTFSIYPFCVFFLAKWLGIVYLQERNEFSFLFRKSNILKRFDNWIYIHFVLKLFDGMYLITDELAKHYQALVKKNAMVKVVPMTVDLHRFENIQPTISFPRPFIAYAGYLWGEKDGIPDLLQAFGIVHQQFPDLDLYLIGDKENKPALERLMKIIRETGIEDHVVFTGRVDREQIPAYLSGATLLVLPRPDSVQAKGGFPTKLGEYLASAKPVVATRVGDIPRYLTDGVDAFLAEPGDPVSIAGKILEALQNPERSRQIGEVGRNTALRSFNYIIQGKMIIDMIQSIKDKKVHAR